MLLMNGNAESNSLQMYTDSPKEFLKQTMQSQEIVFRKQVCELHRLYSIQRLLMEELDFSKNVSHDLWNTSSNPPFTGFSSSSKNETPSEARSCQPIRSTCLLQGNPHFLNNNLLRRNQNLGICSKHEPHCIDLQLPADQYIAQVGRQLAEKGVLFLDCFTKSPKIQCCLVAGDFSNSGEPKLSLSTVEGTCTKECTKDSTGSISGEAEQASFPLSIVPPNQSTDLNEDNGGQNSNPKQVFSPCSSNSSGFDDGVCKNNEEGEEASDRVDDMIQKAAESLVRISLESPAPRHNHCSVGLHDLSDDSFEMMTLGLTECNEDDLLVTSSSLLEVNGREGFGFKFRRGRRLKDFRKDVLPGLASLSSQEICEDINIFQGVIRSREYRQIRSKMGSVGDWCTPMRGKRSRVNYKNRRD